MRERERERKSEREREREKDLDGAMESRLSLNRRESISQ